MKIQVCLLEDGRAVIGGEELLDKPGPKWIDVLAPNEEGMSRLGERYSLHRLAIEDTLHLDQRPKMEEYPGHQFVVLQGFTAGQNICDLTLQEHHFFLGPDWLLSVHEFPFDAHDEVRRRVETDPGGMLGRGVDFILYLLADVLIDRQFPILDSFSDELDDLEAAIFEQAEKRHLQRIFELKRMLMKFRRVLSPQRDVVGLLSRRGIPNVQDKNTPYFRDVYDHLVRLYEQIDSGRDILGNVMDGYLSMVANKTNDITKQLTIFATIFLPLSFIVGFFGQNFQELQGRSEYYAMWVTIVVIPIALIFWFRHKRWI